MKKLLLSLHFFTLLLLASNENLFSMNNSEKFIEEKKEQTTEKETKKKKKRKVFDSDSDQETYSETTTTIEKEGYLLLTKKELIQLVPSKFKENTESELDLLEAFADINNAQVKDKNQKIEVGLAFYKNKNDSNPTFLITTLHTLFNETSPWAQEISGKIAQLHIYLFTLKPVSVKCWDEKLEKDIQKTKEAAEIFSNKIHSLFPKVKNISLNLSSFCPQLPCEITKEQYDFYFQLQNKAKTMLIMSLLNKNWTALKRISIIPGIYILRDKRLLKIFDQLSNISSLRSVTLSGKNDILRTGATGLKSVAQHALIKKLNTLTLSFNPTYIDNENLETIKCLFQKNIAQNTTITLERSTTLFDGEQQFKDIVITKKQKNESENKNATQSINIIHPEDTYAEYEIHLTWVNNKPCDYFAKDEETTNKIVTAALDWAEKNPMARVFIWYDSMFIKNPTSVKNNIEKQVKEKASNISFIDIRNLKRVKKNPKVFSDELPVYFRVDLVREIIIYEMLRLHEADCIIYADIDMTPLTQKQLFDTETVDLLNRYGLVLARVPGDPDKPYENGFQMVVDNKKTAKAIKHMLINTNIEIAKEFLNPPSEEKQTDKIMCFGPYKNNIPQLVYRCFPAMFYYLYFLNGMASTTEQKTITHNGKNNKKNFINMATEAFWNNHGGMVGKTLSFSFKLNKGISEFYPTKLIKIPTIGGKYC